MRKVRYMHVMDEATAEQFGLRKLAETLRARPMGTQQRIAALAGVDQSLVSRARAGQLRRITPKVVRLIEYVNKHVDAVSEVALSAPMRGRRASRPRPVDPESVAVALRKVEQYIADGYDVGLVVSQLDLLASAQRAPRRHGPSARARTLGDEG